MQNNEICTEGLSVKSAVNEETTRTAMLLGIPAIEMLKNTFVAVYGAGGVGGHCIEALARCGIGHIHITDPDTVSKSNLNRQCAATKTYLGKSKTLAMKSRVEDVSDCFVTTSELFVLPDNIGEAVPQGVTFIIDAIDTVSAKIALAEYAWSHNIGIISCMGMGNRLDPTQIRTGDLFDVTGCPLARVMRKELRKRGINELPVVYSLESPMKPQLMCGNENDRTPGSCPFVPSAAGLAMASYAVRQIIKDAE